MDVDEVNTLSRLAKEKGHRVREMGVSSAVEHIFNETARHARAQASNRLARSKQSKSWSKSEGKGKSKENKGKSKGKSKRTKGAIQGAKGPHRGAKHKKLVYQVWKTRNERQARKLRNLHKHVPLTTHGFMMDEFLTNGMMAGVLMNGIGNWSSVGCTKVRNNHMTLLQAHSTWRFGSRCHEWSEAV